MLAASKATKNMNHTDQNVILDMQAFQRYLQVNCNLTGQAAMNNVG